jgi:hypothetical protein
MNEATVTALVPQNAPPPPARRQEVRVVNDPIPVLDTGRFEHMQRVANVMAGCSLIPDALCKVKVKNDQGQDVAEWLPEKQIMANCFMVVNQSVRWGMDPFAVAQCVSVVHGKLCYEGKLIAAVISAKLGYDLEYEISGQNDAMKVVVTAALDGNPVLDSKGQPKKVEGTVSEWQTTGSGSPWKSPGGKPRMLRYRGAREWCRVHAPALMLGVYSDDEMEILADNDRRGYGARDVTTSAPAIEGPRKAPPPPGHAEAEITQVVESPATAPEETKQVDEPKTQERAQEPAAQPSQVRKAPPPPTATAKPADLTAPDDGSIPGFLRRTEEDQAKAPAIPNAEREPEQFLRWAEITMSSATDEDTYETAKALVEQHAKGLFPPDQEEIDACYRRHEQRIAP